MEKTSNRHENSQKPCNHNPSDPNTTLIFSKKKTLVTPEKVNSICSCCYQSFSFTKDENGFYRLE